MNLARYLERSREVFDAYLARQALPETLATVDREIGAVVDYALRGEGKRLRPALVFLAAELPLASMPDSDSDLNGRDPWLDALADSSSGLGRPHLLAQPLKPLTSGLRVALAIECIHTYSLVHDDLPAMDDDDLRRGRPTCHVAFSQWEAILAGDALNTYAFEILAQLEEPASLRVDLIGVLARAAGIRGMVGGQALDLAREKGSAPPRKAEARVAEEVPNSEEDLEAILQKIHSKKTAALIAAALSMGALLAGKSPSEIALYEAYGNSIGLLFQYVDDILDVTADSFVLGKTAGKDGVSGKLSAPLVYGLEGARDRALALSDRALKEASVLPAPEPYSGFWRALPESLRTRLH